MKIDVVTKEEISEIRKEIEILKGKLETRMLFGTEDLMTVSEVADYLGFTPATIKQYIYMGKMPAPRKIGRRNYFTKEDIDSLYPDRSTKKNLSKPADT